MSVEQKVAFLYIMGFPQSLRMILIILAIGIYFVVRKDKIKNIIVAGWLLLGQFVLLFSLATVNDGVGYTNAKIHGAMSPTQTSQDSLAFLLIRWERIILPNFIWTIVIWLVTLSLAFFIVYLLRTWHQREFPEAWINLENEF